MSARPAILQIIPQLETGGAELSTVEIARALVKAGARAIVATEGGRLEGEITAAGGEIVRMPVAGKRPDVLFANAVRLARLIEREGIGLVHARSRAPAWSALLACRGLRGRTPFVTTYHGAYAEKGPAKRLYNSVMARADAVIANSRFTEELIVARYGTDRKRITVIHRGVDEAAFDPARVSDERVAALRAAWGLQADEPVILNAARLTGWKGQKVLIEAAGRLLREGRLGRGRLVLAGDAQGRDGYRRELEALVAARGLQDRAKLVGHVADIPAAFKAAWVAVVASTEPEAFGRAAAEAQAMACPVIATNIGAPPETVLAAPRVADAAITGWLVPPGDAGALAAALGPALQLSTAERAAIGARARAHVTTSFSLTAMQTATLRVYDRLLGTALARRFAGAGA